MPGAAARRRVDLAFAAAVLVTVAVGLAAVLWLLKQAEQADAGTERAKLQADAVKTGVTIALGTGGAAYLLLAYRRQRLDEVDTRERRITELYTKAVEQLGHEKAPVRLGALYSLERLAQNNPEHRQTVVDVFCAYLRMPYTAPAHNEPGAEQEEEAPPADDGDQAPHPSRGQEATQELQVRQTAQRILAAHLLHRPTGLYASGNLGSVVALTRPSPWRAFWVQYRQPSPRRALWPGISLDLTGATLVDLDFGWVSVVQARFEAVTFQGKARFDGATFDGDAWFNGATFQNKAWFTDAILQAPADFSKATFEGEAGFANATFQHVGRFEEATFQDAAVFTKTAFLFTANFSKANFRGNAQFSSATFRGTADFKEGIFTSGGKEAVAGARVLHLDKPDLNNQRIWPHGYTVRSDPADPTRGTLVPAEQLEEPQPAVPPSDRPADNELGTG